MPFQTNIRIPSRNSSPEPQTRAKWGDFLEIQSGLLADGWFTPNTYSGHYRQITDGPAVYLFLMLDRESYSSALVAYVGMSTRLRARLASHNIMPMLESDEYFTMRWFKPTNRHDLRKVEGAYIRRFDPPWNISGRERGVCLQ